MAALLRAQEALERILQAVEPLPVEQVPLAQALGRTLAEAVVAGEDLPPFANSAMDGYALRAADTVEARPEAPRALRMIGEVPAGGEASRSVGPGEAMRIFTGAPLPSGADAVVPQEDTRREEGWVLVLRPVRRSENVRPRGEDVQAGQRVLEAGLRLGPAEVGILAALGWAQVPVHRRPRVGIVTTGSELVEVGEPLKPGQVRDSNAYSLAALVVENDAEVDGVMRVADRAEALHRAFDALAEADLLLTVGGVSVGDYDLVKPVVQERGEILFWRLAIKPGKPLLFALLEGKPLLGLPGNPVSAMVTFEKFARPALWKMMGRRRWERPRVPTRLTHPYRSSPQREEFVRAQTRWTPEGFRSTLTGAQGSGRISSMLGANSLVSIPLGRGEVGPEDILEAELIGPLEVEEER